MHDPQHIAAEEPEIPEPTPPQPVQIHTEPQSSPDQKLLLILVVLVASTTVFALLVWFDIEVPFLTDKTMVRPQNRPAITTPIDIPTVPDHEKDVPTDSTPSVDTETPETDEQANENKTTSEDKAIDVEPPPTGEVEEKSGDTP